ncbi:MAG: hypothetical protein HQL03_06285 [Nitrospirae bacterium]|nr:hypothetical protein [Nitrospirota bacterium]MBF0592804.1 hypothetical protein [Nitrospirota bacterium]
MSFIGYSLMIVAYAILVYEKMGLAIVILVIVASVIVFRYLKKHQPEQGGKNQSIGNGVDADNASFKDIEQESMIDGSSGIKQSVGNGAKAKGNITYKNIKQKIERKD